MKTLKTLWKRLHTNETAVIAVLSIAVATSLAAFERTTSLPASVRSLPLYNALEVKPVIPVRTKGPMQSKPVRIVPKSVHKAAGAKTSVRSRVVRPTR